MRFSSAFTQQQPSQDIGLRSPAGLPRSLWIELTSTCPFRCVFCSRETVRGTGEQMPFELYESLIHQLRDPEIIRLNYAGESTHYPHLIEAIQLAVGTGASTELVSAFSKIRLDLIEPLVKSGLERLTISLHATDPFHFQEIYGRGSIQDLKSRLQVLFRSRQELSSRTPIVDIAFVAMKRNLGQLKPVAAFASKLGIEKVSVFPVIQRSPLPVEFSHELDQGRLRPAFQDELWRAIQEVRACLPNLEVELASAEIGPQCELDNVPRPCPAPLPTGARIHTCEQNPWETIHLLANGTAVACEVLDQSPLGNLADQSLGDIWHGKNYDGFRNDYVTGAIPSCSHCSWKVACYPSPPSSSVLAREGPNSQLLWGWHPPDLENVLWSKRESSVRLRKARHDQWLQIQGILPPASDRGGNMLAATVNGTAVGQVENPQRTAQPFKARFKLPNSGTRDLEIHLSTRIGFRPFRVGAGSDQRELGFALEGIDTRGGLASTTRRLSLNLRSLPLRLSLAFCDRIAKVQHQTKNPPLRWEPGLSLIIPDRGCCEMLSDCLESAFSSAASLDEPLQVIIVGSDCPRAAYLKLIERFPEAHLRYSSKTLSYPKAIQKGLQSAKYDWVYLLNSDMALEKDTLSEVMRWRQPNVFAIASQILPADDSQRREETGWTGLQVKGLQLELADLFPVENRSVRGHVYAGGGSSLFHKALLRKALGSGRPYSPFYWEDAEWGLRAWRKGYEVLFCPTSRVGHRQGSTINHYYPKREIQRVLRRNALQFELRNRLTQSNSHQLLRAVLGMDSRSRSELLSLGNCFSLTTSFIGSALSPCRNLGPQFLSKKYYRRPIGRSQSSPCIVLVSPYALYPPRHGGAVRIHRLIRELAADFRIVVLSDEAEQYVAPPQEFLEGVCSLHLVSGRRQEGQKPGGRIERIRSHCHPALSSELQRLMTCYSPSLVQIEYIELAGLIQSIQRNCPWVLTLHDVLLSDGKIPSEEDRYERQLLAQYDALFATSEEDVRLLPTPAARVIPNGVDLPENPYVPSRGSTTILFMGPFRYPQNLDGILRFLKLVFPSLRNKVPGVRLVILGGSGAVEILSREVPPAELRQVEVLEYVPETALYLEQCALTINPVYKIRGSSIKLLESLAASRICVSTHDGARGFSHLNLPSLVAVEHIEEFEPALLKLLKDEDYRLSLEHSSVSQLRDLTWKRSGRLLKEAYLEILGAH